MKNKNIMIVDGAENCTYDIFQVNQDDFAILFPGEGQDIEFSDELEGRPGIEDICARMWKNRILKKDAMGIHGVIFYGLPEKKKYYPTKKDEEMANP